ncbi:MAG: pyruvate kinase [Chloroflexi bacterium]|nr:pyruvate kinase [Chloroflexota bacterium]
MRQTKIVATLGPASSAPDVVEQLLLAGVDVVRLNFSHGTHAEHAAAIAMLRAVAARLDRPLALLQDLSGPKLRTGPLVGGRPVALRARQRFMLKATDQPGNAAGVGTTYAALARDVRPGDRVLLSDGLIELRVVATGGGGVETEVVTGGELRERQGMHLPGVDVSAPALTDKDLADLAFGLAQGVDWVALSFVRRATDVTALKTRIAAAGKDTPVIAKIEKPEALAELPAIIAAVDGIMVARGDLGVEMPIADVPAAQKHIIATSNAAGIPVITATEMLQSMIEQARPTRAEVSDVANAILDGSDAVMLSGETAIGAYPVAAVATMAAVANATDALRRPRQLEGSLEARLEEPSTSEAIAAAAYEIARVLTLRALVVYTLSGHTAQHAARLRPSVPIVALTPRAETYRRLTLVWGVTPLLCPEPNDLPELSALANDLLKRRQLARPGDQVVLTGGYPFAASGATNVLRVMQITA